MRTARRLTIAQEVTTFKDDWKSATIVAEKMKDVVDRVRTQCEHSGTGQDPLPEDLRELLEELERYVTIFCFGSLSLRHSTHRCIAKSLETLNACKAGSERKRDHFLVYLNRSDLAGSVKQCSVDMKSALDLFNVRSRALAISSDRRQSCSTD